LESRGFGHTNGVTLALREERRRHSRSGGAWVSGWGAVGYNGHTMGKPYVGKSQWRRLCFECGAMGRYGRSYRKVTPSFRGNTGFSEAAAGKNRSSPGTGSKPMLLVCMKLLRWFRSAWVGVTSEGPQKD